MEFDKVVSLIAQGAINISEGLTEIEAGSPVHTAMQELCRLASANEIAHVHAPNIRLCRNLVIGGTRA